MQARSVKLLLCLQLPLGVHAMHVQAIVTLLIVPCQQPAQR